MVHEYSKPQAQVCYPGDRQDRRTAAASLRTGTMSANIKGFPNGLAGPGLEGHAASAMTNWVDGSGTLCRDAIVVHPVGCRGQDGWIE